MCCIGLLVFVWFVCALVCDVVRYVGVCVCGFVCVVCVFGFKCVCVVCGVLCFDCDVLRDVVSFVFLVLLVFVVLVCVVLNSGCVFC